LCSPQITYRIRFVWMGAEVSSDRNRITVYLLAVVAMCTRCSEVVLIPP
jgi:hypothetical protein